MRMPEAGPLGDTFFDASARATAEAFLVKRPVAGCVESVLTFDIQRFFLDLVMPSPDQNLTMPEMQRQGKAATHSAHNEMINKSFQTVNWWRIRVWTRKRCSR